MKCSTHPSDCGDGVCAFCLRERLSIITASLAGDDDLLSPDDTERSSVPPLLDGHQSALIKFDGKNRVARKLSLASPSPKKGESDDAVSGASGSPSSCLPGLTLGRKKRNKMTSLHVHPVNTQGMSPVSDEEAAKGGFAAKQSPSRCTSSPPIRRQHSPRSFSSLVLCLSPLGRPIPGTHGGHTLPDMTLPVKIRGTFNRRCGGGGVPELPSALGTSRSRKLADLGKIW